MPIVGSGLIGGRTRGGAESGGRKRGGASSGAGRKKPATASKRVPPQLSEWLEFAADYRAKHRGANLKDISAAYQARKGRSVARKRVARR